MADAFLTRQPLLNGQRQVIAVRLTLHLGAGGRMKEAAQTLNLLTDCWSQGEKSVFVGFGKTPCDAGLFDWVVPENATIELPSAAFTGADAVDFVATLAAQQASLCLAFDAQAGQAIAAGAKFRFIGFDAKTYTPAQLKLLAEKTQPFGIPVALNVDTLSAFHACLDAGMSAAAGWFIKQAPATPGKSLNPGQAHIVRLLNLVRKNANPKEIEAALKQDVALSYKLLRYINSAGFGLSCEIQSFRHAVTILGYEKLNKWLSLLLVTASKDPIAPAVMHTALTRARLMELLSAGLIDKGELDNLFITGAFSLLDVLLGVGMEQALDAMHLPEPIIDALLGRGGLYAPFLELAKTCEDGDGAALADQAAMLGLGADQVNRAQLQALAFAETMAF